MTDNKGDFDVPIELTLFGPSDPHLRSQIEERLKADRILKATQLKKTRMAAEVRRKRGELVGHNTYSLNDDKNAPTVEEIALGSMLVNSHGRQDAIQTMAMDEATLERMPMASQPKKLKAELLPYQLQGLFWMMAKENPQLPAGGDTSDTVQLWKRDPSSPRRFVNVASNFVTSQRPHLLSGGILADDMGLGKTLQVISLILSAKTGPTLIVAPVTVMSNWAQQIQRHVQQEHMLSVVMHYGTRAKMTMEELKSHDVVVTSYGKVTAENKLADHQKVLLAVDWHRVVLDEGHVIRNSRTETATAVRKLKAKSRWVLSGTPM